MFVIAFILVTTPWLFALIRNQGTYLNAVAMCIFLNLFITGIFLIFSITKFVVGANDRGDGEKFWYMLASFFLNYVIFKLITP